MGKEDQKKESVPVVPPTKQVLYQLRYKRGMSHVQTGYIMASSQEKAEKVGRAYCDAIPGCRYVHVDIAILADESILAPVREAEVTDNSSKAASASPSAAA